MESSKHGRLIEITKNNKVGGTSNSGTKRPAKIDSNYNLLTFYKQATQIKLMRKLE